MVQKRQVSKEVEWELCWSMEVWWSVEVWWSMEVW